LQISSNNINIPVNGEFLKTITILQYHHNNNNNININHVNCERLSATNRLVAGARFFKVPKPLDSAWVDRDFGLVARWLMGV
jgi:hypothetical protein